MVTNSTYPIEVRTAFNGSAFNFTLQGQSIDNALSSSGPAYAYYGHFANNLTLPVGAKDYYAYTAFGAEGISPLNARLSTDIDVFLPQFDCEAAKIITDPIDQDPGIVGFSSRATFETTSCTVEHVNLAARDPKIFLCPPEQIIGQWSLVDCKTKSTTMSISAPWTGDNPDIRFMVAVTDFRYTQTPAYYTSAGSRNESVFNATDFSTAIAGINGVICKPLYSMTRANFTYDTSKQNENDRFSTAQPKAMSGKLLDNFSNDNLSSAVDTVLSMSDEIVGIRSSSTENLQPEAPDILSKLMLLTEGESSLHSFLADTEVMRTAAIKTFNGLAAQYAQQNLLKPASKASTGQIVYVENRLKVQTISMALIVACLVFLIFLAVVVLLSRPHEVVPRKPDSLGAIAIILASNQSLQNLLAGLGRSPTSSIRQRLSPFHISSHVIPGTNREANFHLEPSKSESNAEMRKETTGSHHWHRPLSIRRGFIGILLPLPLIVIGILEGLQQASNRHDGFMTLPKDSSHQSGSTTIWVRFLPALFMLLIATLFNMLDFTVTTFAPYSALRVGSSPAKRSIFSHLFGELPPVALYQAAAEHHWGALFSNLAGLTGSVLAIIVSGLLVVENINVPSNVSVQQFDSFTIDTFNPNDGNATATLSLIEQFNLSFPVFTYEELAFPSIKLLEETPILADVAGQTDNASLLVQLPALRASLDCKPVPQEDIIFRFNQNPYMQPAPQVVLETKIDLSDGCGGASTGWNFTFPVADGNKPTSYVPDPDNGWSFAGSIIDLPDVTIQSSDCPSFMFFFGSFKMNVTSYENLTMMTCSEHVQQIQTRTTFTLPQLAISYSSPPILNLTTTTLLRNTTSNHTALQYSVAKSFSTNFIPFYSFLSPIADRRPLDTFFQALTLGSDATPAPSLLGAVNSPLLLSKVSHLYAKYMAQLLHSNMRTPPLYPNPTYPATISLPTARLKINPGSKVTLQILLAVMFTAATLAYLLTDMRHTLPHNPHTLAGVMTLVAGSEMCSRAVVPQGAEWMTDQQLREKGVFDGYLFSLGWWEERESESERDLDPGGVVGRGRRRFGVDVGRAEREGLDVDGGFQGTLIE